MHGPDPATSATTDGARARRGRPGGGRPSGRAVVGGLLVALAAIAVFSAYAGAGERPTRSMVVARRAVAPGHTLTDADVEVRVAELPDELAGRAFGSADEVVGAVALGPLAEGDLVQAGSVRVGAGDDRPEFSFPVEREQALAGDVRSGEEVDLLATFGTGSDAETVVLARGAQVREVDEAGSGTIGSSGRLVLTVGLASGDEVLDLAHAAQVATITVVRAGGADRGLPGLDHVERGHRGPVVIGEHYLVLGLARPRAAWIGEVGRWSSSAALPAEFVRCVSADEVRARLRAGRAWSALLVEEGCSGVDRDLLDEARRAGCSPVVVISGVTTTRWVDLGAATVLAEPLDRDGLLAALREHAVPVGRGPGRGFGAPGGDVPEGAEPSATTSGRLVTVLGGGGTGTSTIAMAAAQAAGADPVNGGLVALVDASLHATQALLHHTGDVVPGLQELVEVHRTSRPDPGTVRAGLWAFPDRGYDLLPGLRRHRDWTALRPRALAATVGSLRRTYATVVADADADLEGEAETGSIDVEERNVCARTLVAGADVVVATGVDGPAGVHRLVRTLADLVAHGIEPSRILPVIGRTPRAPHRRAELARTVALLLGELAPGTSTVSPLMVPWRRDLDALVIDGAPLPRALWAPVGAAIDAVADRAGAAAPAVDEPVPIRPGTLGTGGAR